MVNGPVNKQTQASVWEILSSDEDKKEFIRIVDNDEFVQALLDSEAQDGFELVDRYHCFERDGLYFIALTEEDAPAVEYPVLQPITDRVFVCACRGKFWQVVKTGGRAD